MEEIIQLIETIKNAVVFLWGETKELLLVLLGSLLSIRASSKGRKEAHNLMIDYNNNKSLIDLKNNLIFIRELAKLKTTGFIQRLENYKLYAAYYEEKREMLRQCLNSNESYDLNINPISAEFIVNDDDSEILRHYIYNTGSDKSNIALLLRALLNKEQAIINTQNKIKETIASLNSQHKEYRRYVIRYFSLENDNSHTDDRMHGFISQIMSDIQLTPLICYVLYETTTNRLNEINKELGEAETYELESLLPANFIEENNLSNYIKTNKQI